MYESEQHRFWQKIDGALNYEILDNYQNTKWFMATIFTEMVDDNDKTITPKHHINQNRGEILTIFPGAFLRDKIT